MSEYLIIDGYNVLNNWPELVKIKKRSLEHARDLLVRILANYGALKRYKIILVFDAYQVKGNIGGKETVDDVEIIYTPYGVTADMAIEKLIGKLPEGVSVMVATSDWTEQRMVMGKGALRLSARELRLEVLREKEKVEKMLVQENHSSPLDSQLSEGTRQVLEEWRRQK